MEVGKIERQKTFLRSEKEKQNFGRKRRENLKKSEGARREKNTA